MNHKFSPESAQLSPVSSAISLPGIRLDTPFSIYLIWDKIVSLMSQTMNQASSTWQNQVNEEPLEPALPICDAHHHLWDRPGDRYLIEDLVKDAVGQNVVSSVFIECGAFYRKSGPEVLKPVGETETVHRLAEDFERGNKQPVKCGAAIVGYADLRLGEAVESVLEAHLKASPTRFRGIRHNVCWDESADVPRSHTKPAKGLLLDSQFRKGLSCLKKHNLLYEVYLYHTQLEELLDLARAYPEQPIVLNHFGGPLGIGPYAGKRAEILDYWKQCIHKLATCSNVIAKLGGILMPRNGFGFHEREIPPTSQELSDATSAYYHFAIDTFGPDRCLFESNFPVEKVSCSYRILWNSFKRIAARYSDSERASLFREVAEKVYRIRNLD